MKLLLSALLTIVLVCNADAKGLYFDDIPQHELDQLTATRPYFNRNLGRVTVESSRQYAFLDYFRNALKNLLFSSGAFDAEADDRLRVTATFLQASQSGDRSPISYIVKIKYDLLNGDNVVGSWTITTKASSTGLMAIDRADNALELATQRNLRSFLLNLKASYDRDGSDAARKALVELGSEADGDTRNLSALAVYLVIGTADAVKATASAAGAVAGAVLTGLAEANAAGVTAQMPSPSPLAQGGDRILDNLNKQNNVLSEINRQKAMERQAQADAKARNERRAEELGREQAEERRRRLADAQRQEDRTRVERESRQRQHERREAEAQQQAQRERERIKQETERAAAQAREEAQRRQEREAAEQKRKQEAADRAAAAQAEKAAKEKAMNDYMSSMVSGIRLSAINCFGSTEVTGSVPKIKGADYCIDVHFTARCPGDPVGSKGVAKNFLGMGGCMGDTTTVTPKPACKAEAVVVEVTDVRPGCRGSR